MDQTQTSLLWAVRDAGNRQAWTDFHRIYAPLVRVFCRRLGLTDADADDATQELMMLAHDALCRGVYDPRKGRFRGWLYGVARKRALMAHRARRRPTRAQAVPTEDGLDLISGLEDKHDEAERRIWEQEWRYALLEEAMRQLQPTLPEKTFQAFVLYAVEQRPVEQVAAELRISASSVYVYKSRVLDAIREWTAGFEDDEPDRPSARIDHER